MHILIRMCRQKEIEKPNISNSTSIYMYNTDTVHDETYYTRGLFTRIKPMFTSTDCYTGIGLTYEGTASVRLDGNSCGFLRSCSNTRSSGLSQPYCTSVMFTRYLCAIAHCNFSSKSCVHFCVQSFSQFRFR